MSTVHETGHAKNVANFEKIIAFVSGYGAVYNPNKATLQYANLLLLSDKASAAIATLNLLLPSFSNAVAARANAFEPLNKLSTRVFNSLKATDALPQVIANAQTNHRKLTGQRASAKLSAAELLALQAEGKEAKQVSASQQSYDSRLDSFDKQIQLLANIPSYAPNEIELQVASLKALYLDLKDKNFAVIKQSLPVATARIARNEVLYNAETGVVAVAQDVKNYAKSIFGTSDANYKLISGISITKGKA